MGSENVFMLCIFLYEWMYVFVYVSRKIEWMALQKKRTKMGDGEGTKRSDRG